VCESVCACVCVCVCVCVSLSLCECACVRVSAAELSLSLQCVSRRGSWLSGAEVRSAPRCCCSSSSCRTPATPCVGLHALQRAVVGMVTMHVLCDGMSSWKLSRG